MTAIDTARAAIEVIENSNDIALKYHAIWWLGKNKERYSLQILCRILNDNNDQTDLGGFPLRRQAARSLGMIADSESIPALLKALDSSDLRLQEATILALRSIGDHSIIPELIEYLNTANKEKPLEALIEALASFEVWDVADSLRKYLNDDSKRIEGAACVYFYRMTKDSQYLSALMRNLSDDNAFLRQSAAFDLAQCNDTTLNTKITAAKLPNNVKMAALKQILETYVIGIPELELRINSSNVNPVIHELLSDIDRLIIDATQGNLPTQNSYTASTTVPPSPLTTAKEHVIKLLLNNPAQNEELLAILARGTELDCQLVCDACFKNKDQDIRAGIVQLLYFMDCTQAVPVLKEVIGLEIANHCQGKLRRVALLALGKLYHKLEQDKEAQASIQETLQWALVSPDDWGLRYAAVMAYEAMALCKPLDFDLCSETYRSCQTDKIIGLRMTSAESTICNAEVNQITAELMP